MAEFFYYPQDGRPNNDLTARTGEFVAFTPVQSFPEGADSVFGDTKRQYAITSGALPPGFTMTQPSDVVANAYGGVLFALNPTTPGVYELTIQMTAFGQYSTGQWNPDLPGSVSKSVSIRITITSDSPPGPPPGPPPSPPPGPPPVPPTPPPEPPPGPPGPPPEGPPPTPPPTPPGPPPGPPPPPSPEPVPPSSPPVPLPPPGGSAPPEGGKGFKITRVGDSCTHGAMVITGDDTRLANGRKVARVGDTVSCPIHGANEIIAQTAHPVITNGRKTSRLTSVCACGAVILTGSEDVLIDR